jgi:hypothetical protein
MTGERQFDGRRDIVRGPGRGREGQADVSLPIRFEDIRAMGSARFEEGV